MYLTLVAFYGMKFVIGKENFISYISYRHSEIYILLHTLHILILPHTFLRNKKFLKCHKHLLNLNHNFVCLLNFPKEQI